MNTYERHRQYLLRKRRTRRIRRRALMVLAGVLCVLVAWTLASEYTPEQYAPPDPASVGAGAAKTLATQAAKSVNTIHATLKPGYREEAKQAVLAMFEERAPVGENTRMILDTVSVTVSRTAPVVPLVRIELPDLDTLLPDDTSVLLLPQSGHVSGASANTPRRQPQTKRRPRVLDILLIGLDSRLGSSRGRADALQLITVDFDAPHVTITGIPRGTYSDLGYENEASNIIANVRSARGRSALLKRVARLCRRDSVPYYVEVGFSDALGVLELLGYGDPVAELQALRQRRRYQYGDHNRCYNQGLFVRDAMLRMLPLLEGVTGDVLLRAGRDLVATNLSHDQCRGIAYLLNDAGVSMAASMVSVTIRSRFRKQILSDQLEAPHQHAVRGIDYSDLGGTTTLAERRIRKALAKAEADSASPQRVHDRLWTMFQQHGWMQIADRDVRRALRDSLAVVLKSACTDLGRNHDIALIHRTVKADEILFHREEN